MDASHWVAIGLLLAEVRKHSGGNCGNSSLVLLHTPDISGTT